MLILTDTGILLRLFDPKSSLHRQVDLAVRGLRSRGHRLVYTFQNATEFWNVCTRPSTARGGMGLDTAETNTRVSMIESSFPLLTESGVAYTEWRRLVSLYQIVGKQVHDARLVSVISEHGITHILSLNSSDFTRYNGIVAIDPLNLIIP